MSVKMVRVAAALVLASGIVLSKAVIAQTAAMVTEDNKALISDDGLGVQMRFDKDGRMLSVKSTYHHPVEFPDRRGVNKAYIIAEEKAKANIARFMSQTVATSRIVTELDKSQSQSNRDRSGDGENWTKENSRTVSESLREVTTSGAAAVLRGVRILERSYDEDAEEVTVVVGINRQSQAGAQQLESGLQAPAESASPTSQTQGNAPAFPNTGSEKRRSDDFDDF